MSETAKKRSAMYCVVVKKPYPIMDSCRFSNESCGALQPKSVGRSRSSSLYFSRGRAELTGA